MTARVLPIELYQIIFQHVINKNELCSLARCSSTFQVAAEPFIYHSFGSLNIIKFIKAAKSTISRPHRHRLVKTIDLGEPHWITPANTFYHSTIPRLVAKFLGVTSQLRALRIDGFLQSRWLLKDRNHPLLVTLSIAMPAAHLDSRVELKNQLYSLQYLERHGNITKLTVEALNHEKGGSSVLCWDAANHLPNLDTLYYIGRKPSSLLKDRHLHRFRWKFSVVHEDGDREEMVSCLLAMGSTLQVLDLSESCFGPGGGWKVQSVQDLIRNLQSLRCFGLPLLKHDMYNEDDLVHILQSCPPTLEILKLNYSHDFDTLNLNLLKIFSAQESLKWTIIASSWSISFGDAVYAKEMPERALIDRSALKKTLWDLGVRTEPWEGARRTLRDLLTEGFSLEEYSWIKDYPAWRLIRGL
ncbi:hypothetical protein FRC02_007757 [Tulasnella sp. 418]|nr:hypothetical protein FRC02_007757 [Tulasnella sp. 418]